MPLFTVPQGRHSHRLRTLLIAGLVYLFCSAPTTRAESAVTPQILAKIARVHGEYALRRINHWQLIINMGSRLSEREKLAKVNTFFNELKFISDIDHWGKEDYWATPLQTLASNGGDCEDFSIAKYFTLLQMGVPAKRMRLTYVKALELNQAHMVLTYFETPESDPLVLDNLKADIEPASRRSDLQPVYSFNVEGLWLAKSRGTDQHVGRPERLSQWNSVIARIGNEQLAALH
jgi:predicted transglutaminase-like cysteine proteinase